jgi:anti-sigma factor RsiW
VTGPDHGAECRELFARLSEYLDGELDPAPCAALEGHLADCAPCREFLESLRRTVGHLRAAPAAPLPADLRESLVAAWNRARGGV